MWINLEIGIGRLHGPISRDWARSQYNDPVISMCKWPSTDPVNETRSTHHLSLCSVTQLLLAVLDPSWDETAQRSVEPSSGTYPTW